jgi:chromosome condensin MukBEF ATPase and DNA-binding subunit MukB
MRAVELLEQLILELARLNEQFIKEEDKEVITSSSEALTSLYHWMKKTKQYKKELIRRKLK